MASAFSCDGCGAAVDKPIVVGHVIRRDYCAPCAEIANGFVDEEEAIRREAQSGFAAAREKLVKAALDHLNKLPDVPDAD